LGSEYGNGKTNDIYRENVSGKGQNEHMRLSTHTYTQIHNKHTSFPLHLYLCLTQISIHSIYSTRVLTV